ncbi:MAG: hypothetical protein BGO31_00720 [Bacteroidetes bacterium 43-16]|nr:MAG: hypothetical protein BGO31_00720 [Bacteroidetes bacterium 43-16]
MRKFYQSTYYFWIISKFLMAIAGFISSISILQESNNLREEEKIANYLCLIYSILLVLDNVFSLQGKPNRAIKYITGTISVVIGLALFILMLYMKVISIPLTIAFVILVLLMGLFDLLQVNKRTELQDDDTI